MTFSNHGILRSILLGSILLTASNATTTHGQDSATTTQPASPQMLNWPHWRGPTMDGHAYDTGLPESWSEDGENLLWDSAELGSRGTPVAMNGKMYIACRAFPESNKEGEKTVCFDPKTGKIIWESIHNVFLSDAPAERVSWLSPVCDPATNRVYIVGIGGVLQCLDGDTGKTVWERSMMEEYGMISPYGGRTNLMTHFEDLAIFSSVMTGWGDTAVPAHRYVAFDKNSGMPAWMFSTKLRPEDTTYSTPVYTVLNGQAALVVGAADGAIYALQPRTGKQIWKYQVSPRGINVTPLVDENGIVYCAHGEKNQADRTILGAAFAFDGNTTGEIPEEKLLWKVNGLTVSRCAPVKLDNRIYIVDDGGKMYGYDAKTGEEVAKKALGRFMYGSILAADGKLYTCEHSGIVYILKPTAEGIEVLSKVKLDEAECYATPMVYQGRVYISTTSKLYCIGSENNTSPVKPLPVAKQEEPKSKDQEIAHIQIAPVELLLKPGKKVEMQVRAYNKNGQFLKLIDDAEIKVDGGGSMDGKQFVAPETETSLAVIINATRGELKSQARVRVIAELPIKADFNDGKVPMTWIGTAYRHQPVNVEGDGALVKVSTIPKGTRSQAWFGWPSAHDYTVQADFYATNQVGKDTTDRLPDLGLVAQRYTLDMQGDQVLQIRSWTSRLENRFAKTIPFQWKQMTWYTMKFQAVTEGAATTLRGKVWERGTEEPADWTIEATDATGNMQGSPGMFGNATRAQFYVDNVSVTPNQ
jgi:outer membrane protein assembly factor BamB